MTTKLGPAPRAITFDLDYTLWDLSGVLHQAEADMYAFLARVYPKVTERYSDEALRALRSELYERRQDLRYNVTELRKAALAQVADECGYGETLVEEAFEVFLEGRHKVKLFPDTLPLLRRLEGRYVIGVITNGNADVARLGLRGHFDFVLSPMDVGAAKPDRVIFEAACHRAGVEPERVMHVGDEPEADIVGAADYGMQAVWMNRAGSPWPQEFARRPHLQVSSLRELERLLFSE